MNTIPIVDIPIGEIRIVNPRTRTKVRFQAIVTSIETLGLKKPITVSSRETAEDGTKYDLVCGQGRIEAFLSLGQASIPAVIINASREDQLLMGLVENIARRPASNKDLFREVLNLKERGYDLIEIATKLGRDREYIGAILHLIDYGESYLVESIEADRIPVSIAVMIASADDPGVQRALSDAYESGALRGARFKEAKRIIARCAAKRRRAGQPAPRRKLTGDALVKDYQRRTREQRALVLRAGQTKDNLLLIKSAFRKLLTEEHFVTLLRAEGLQDIPEPLVDASD
jgi:ParB family transcriptional regulator, chromosome partitioning protein